MGQRVQRLIGSCGLGDRRCLRVVAPERSAFWGCLFLAIAFATLVRAEDQPAHVVVTPVIQKTVPSGRSFVGTVMPVRVSLIGSAASGRVEEFLVNEGDRVKKGQVLARLRTKLIDAELAAARATLQMRQAELDELRNGARPEEIAQAKARLTLAEELHKFRRAQLQRMIAAGRSASAEQLEEAASLAAQSAAARLEAEAALKLLELGPRQERIKQAQARVDAQKEEVARLVEQRLRHTVAAPFDGYVVAERTEIGQWLAQGDPVVEIIELDSVEVAVDVPEDSITNLRKGDSARVHLSALPERTFSGTIAAVVPRANTRSHTFTVKVRVANERDGDEVLIKAGMFARVTLQVGSTEQAILVPKDALVLGGPTPLVYTVERTAGTTNRGVARSVPVQLGVADGQLIQVIGNLRPGQLVVTQGNERLRPNQTVEIVE